MSSSSFNPYATPSSAIETSADRQWQQRVRHTSMRRNCLYFCIVVAIALVAAYDRVHTILIFGPVLAIAGLILALQALKNRDVATILLGMTAPLFVLLITLLIFQGFFGPTELKSCIQLLSCCYAMVILPSAISLVINRTYQAPVQFRVKNEDRIWSYE